jgi:hypothetical protein
MRVRMRVKKLAKYIPSDIYWNPEMDKYLGQILELEKGWMSYHGKGWSWHRDWLEKPFEYSNETDP